MWNERYRVFGQRHEPWPGVRKALRVTMLLTSVFCAAGCAGTGSAVVAGPALGGTSLTTRVWKTETDDVVKVLATPFAFAAGTVTGIVPSMWWGVRYDLENCPMGEFKWSGVDPEEISDVALSDVWDPFGAGLWSDRSS